MEKSMLRIAKLLLLVVGIGFGSLTLYAQPEQEIKPGPVQRTFSKGESILVEWKGKWWHANITKTKKHKFRVHYQGWPSKWDEWVKVDRMAKDCSVTHW